MMRAKAIPPLKRRMSILLLAAFSCVAFSGCGSYPTQPKTDMSLVANPSEEAPSPSEEAQQSSSPQTQPTASNNPAPPLRQMLLAEDAVTTDPMRLEVLASMVKTRAQSEVFPDYSHLFADFDEEGCLSLLLLADEMVYGDRTPIHPLPLEGKENEVYYDAESVSYHIPSRSLTEEEKLMVLDWEMQANHQLLNDALDHLDGGEYTAETEEGRLVNRAVHLLQGAYNISMGDLEYHLRDYPYGEDEIWQLQFFRPNAHTLSHEGQPCEWYLVEFFASDGGFYRMGRGYTDLAAATGTVETPGPLNPSSTTIDNLRQDDYWAQDAREIVEEFIQPLSSIQDIYFQRFDGDDLLILRAAMEDGTSYRFNYSLLSRLPSEIKFLSTQELPLSMDPLLPSPSPVAAEGTPTDGGEDAALESSGESPALDGAAELAASAESGGQESSEPPSNEAA